MLRLLSLLALTGLLGVAPLAHAQSADSLSSCDPVQGTIQVADDDDPDAAALAKVTADQARETALQAVPGATVTDVDLEEEDGFLVYEVDLRDGTTEYDLIVDAGSGAVLCTERDD